MSHSNVTLIINPAAGKGRGLKLLPEIERTLSGLGVDFIAKISTGPGEPELLAREAAGSGSGIVAAVGGDGLAGMIANGLVGTSCALAVIPTGTGNDFARTIGLNRRKPLRATEMLANPRIQRVDAGRITSAGPERYFVNVAGAGFDSQVNETANRMRSHLSGTAKYVIALGKTLRRFEPANFGLTVDGDTTETRAMMVVVGNGRSYGGGMKVCPDASINDGELDVCIVNEMGKTEFLRSFPKVFRGTHVKHSKVTMLKGSRISLKADRDIQVYADGELAASLPAELEVVPGALRLVMP